MPTERACPRDGRLDGAVLCVQSTCAHSVGVWAKAEATWLWPKTHTQQRSGSYCGDGCMCSLSENENVPRPEAKSQPPTARACRHAASILRRLVACVLVRG